MPEPPGPAQPTEPDLFGEEAPPAHLSHFILERPLGVGGMGMVFAARDVTLGRSVALKLVRPDAASAKGHERLLREAHALASLSHPNVVTVHEVGEANGRVFIAMELIDGGAGAGSTLREWMRRARPWREVAECFLAAGRGLAAVHAIGLVHRDFKPSNVLIDGHGGVKVGDFGLVAAEGEAQESAERSPIGERSPALTTVGALIGTPAYMAPEQARGDRCDARSDQYSFCVSFHEALTGAFPDGMVAGAGPRRPVPRQLRALLQRGLREKPAERYPSMTELLADLERAARPRPTTWIVAGVAAAAVLAAGIVMIARRPAANPCPPPTDRLAGVWDGARRDAAKAHLIAIDPARGLVRFQVAAARLDGYTRAWSNMQVAACRATRVTGEQSDTMLDQRRRCLDRRLALLREAADQLLAATDPRSLDRALDRSARLDPLDGCADTAALAQVVPPPADPTARARVERIEREVDAINAERRAGRHAGLLDRVVAVANEARAAGHGPTLVAALLSLADTQIEAGSSSAATDTLRELTQAAAAARADHAAALAWTKLVLTVGSELGKVDEALGLLAAAEAAVVRAGSPLDLRARLLYYTGQLYQETDKRPEALIKLAEARKLLEEAGAASSGSSLGPFLGDVILETGGAQAAAGEHEAAIRTYREAVDVYRRVHGPDHPDEAYAWHNLGEQLRRTSRYDDAVAAFREAIRIREARQGETPLIAGSYAGVANTMQDAGRWEEALEALNTAVRISREKLAPDDINRVTPLITLARAYKKLGRWDETRQALDEALAVFERTGARNLNLAIAYFNRGNVESDQGKWAASIEWYDRSIAVFEEAAGPTTSRLVFPLFAKGRALVQLRRPIEAMAPLERALALETPGEGRREQALARFYRGRALVESKRDRRGGLSDARAGRAALAALAPDDQELPTIDTWLAAHR